MILNLLVTVANSNTVMMIAKPTSTFSLNPNTQMQAYHKNMLWKKDRCPCTKRIWRGRAAPEVTINDMTEMVKNIQVNGYLFRDSVHT